MFWEEKIDRVKKKFAPKAFKDPYLAGPAAVEKIIRTFHRATPLTYNAAVDKGELLKDKTLIKTCSPKQLYQTELLALNDNTNYWLLLVHTPMGPRNRVYDCQKEALRYVSAMAAGIDNLEFYIVDKKYAWLAFFKTDTAANFVEIYKSGNTPTPFG